MKKQFLFLALLATTAITRPNDYSYEETHSVNKNGLEEKIYKVSFLLGIASIASAISKGDDHITRGLSYAAASGFFAAPLANAYKSKKISNQAMLALSGLITGASFINTPNDFEHEEKRELLGSLTTALAGLCNIRSGHKLIHNAFFSAISCIGGYKIYTTAYKILYPELDKFEPLEELGDFEKELPLSFEIKSASDALPLPDETSLSLEELQNQN